MHEPQPASDDTIKYARVYYKVKSKVGFENSIMSLWKAQWQYSKEFIQGLRKPAEVVYSDEYTKSVISADMDESADGSLTDSVLEMLDMENFGNK